MLNTRRSCPVISFATFLLATLFSDSQTHASGMYQLTDLGVAPANYYVPIINASGQVIPDPSGGGSLLNDGTYSTGSRNTGPAGSYQGVLYQNGSLIATITTLVGPLTNDEIIPHAVNKSGMVVGSEQSGNFLGPWGTAFSYTVGGGFHAIPQLDPSPNILMAALSVNNSGLIVGTSTGPGGYSDSIRKAFLSDGQTSWDLNTLIAPGSGLTLTSATDISDSGQIAGFGVDSKGQEHIVLLTPNATPEPSVLMIFAAGSLAVVARRTTRVLGAKFRN